MQQFVIKELRVLKELNALLWGLVTFLFTTQRSFHFCEFILPSSILSSPSTILLPSACFLLSRSNISNIYTLQIKQYNIHTGIFGGKDGRDVKTLLKVEWNLLKASKIAEAQPALLRHRARRRVDSWVLQWNRVCPASGCLPANISLCWWRKPFFVFGHGLDILSGVTGLHVEGDGLATHGLQEDLCCQAAKAAEPMWNCDLSETYILAYKIFLNKLRQRRRNITITTLV